MAVVELPQSMSTIASGGVLLHLEPLPVLLDVQGLPVPQLLQSVPVGT
jgi:hypothetical protein